MSTMVEFSRSWLRVAAVVALGVGASSAVYAMRVSPMVVEMTTSGSGARRACRGPEPQRGQSDF